MQITFDQLQKLLNDSAAVEWRVIFLRFDVMNIFLKPLRSLTLNSSVNV